MTADEDDEEKQLTTSGASSASSSSSGSSSGDRGFVSREAFAPLDPNTPSKPLLAKARMRSSKSTSTKNKSQSRTRLSITPTQTVLDNSRAQQPPPTRIRKPSIRLSSGRPSLPKSHSLVNNNDTPQLQSHRQAPAPPVAPRPAIPPTPRYDPSDEENLPSPFLKRADRERMANTAAISKKVTTNANTTTAATNIGSRRKSNSNVLRAIAAANSAAHNQPNGAPAVKAT